MERLISPFGKCEEQQHQASEEQDMHHVPEPVRQEHSDAPECQQDERDR